MGKRCGPVAVIPPAEDYPIDKRNGFQNLPYILLYNIRRRIRLHAHPGFEPRLMQRSKRADALHNWSGAGLESFSKVLEQRNNRGPMLILFSVHIDIGQVVRTCSIANCYRLDVVKVKPFYDFQRQDCGCLNKA